MGKEMLNDNELLGIVGGKKAGSKKAAKASVMRKKEFEAAWNNLKMDEQGYSGMKLAELYDEWEMSDFKTDAASFISANA